jgi:phage portal protein BeeE
VGGTLALPPSQLVVGPAALAVNARTILGESVAHRCVQLIADALGNARWGEWRGLEQLEDSRLVRRPAQRMTRRNWTWRTAATMALWSWCPLLRVGGLDSDGVIGSLVPVLPDEVAQRDGSWWYRGQDRGPDGIRPVYRDVWPGLEGELLGVIALARETFTAAFAAASYDAAYWENGGSPRTIITTDQALTQDQADEIRTRYTTQRRDNPGQPAVFGRGAKLDAFGADLSGSGAAEASGRLGAAVARYFGVPPHLANVPNYASSLTYVNTESAGIDLVRYTLSAYSGAIGDAVSEELPGDYQAGRHVILDLADLTVPDLESQGRYFQAALGRWLTREEIRAALHLPNLPDSAFDQGAPAPAPAAGSAPPLQVVNGGIQ